MIILVAVECICIKQRFVAYRFAIYFINIIGYVVQIKRRHFTFLLETNECIYKILIIL